MEGLKKTKNKYGYIQNVTFVTTKVTQYPFWIPSAKLKIKK